MMGDPNIIRFPVLGSTNDHLNDVHADVDDMTIIVAGRQTRGRGRFGREWVSDDGGLWFSVLVRHDDPEHAFLLTFAAAVSVAEAIRKAAPGLEPKIKWPNDVLIGQKKVCGILTENVIGGRGRGSGCDSIVGIGLNVNNDPPLDTSTSLSHELDRELDLTAILDSFVLVFSRYREDFRRRDYRRIIDGWKVFWGSAGKQVHISTVHGDLDGIAEDIADDGSLIIRSGGEVSSDVEKVQVLEGDLILPE